MAYPDQTAYPESERCADCGRPTSFKWETTEGWLSVCCAARAKPVEPVETD